MVCAACSSFLSLLSTPVFALGETLRLGFLTVRSGALAKADAACFSRACLALAQIDLTPLLAGIRNPAFVTAGALDAATPAPLARELANDIPGAKFLEIPECGHCPQLEKSETFVQAVEQFLP